MKFLSISKNHIAFSINGFMNFSCQLESYIGKKNSNYRNGLVILLAALCEKKLDIFEIFGNATCNIAKHFFTYDLFPSKTLFCDCENLQSRE